MSTVVRINREQRRRLDREIAISKRTIKTHLDFLNKVGSPQYELRKMSSFKWRVKCFFARFKK